MSWKKKIGREHLLSLAPTTSREGYSYYIEELKRVTKSSDYVNNNIALEGDYATGKSSIVQGLMSEFWFRVCKRPKIISFLSFSLLGNAGAILDDPSKIKNTDNKMNASTNTRNVTGSDGAKKTEKNLSMVIQKEIIKQLYYGEKPNKLKGSGYSRIGRRYWMISYLISIPITLFIIMNTYVEFSNFFTSCVTKIEIISGWEFNFDLAFCLQVVVSLILATAIAYILNWIFRQIFRYDGKLKQLSTRNLLIELDDKKPDLDQLVDLLVYYFRKTRRKVVIFEDLDRFNTVDVFEELCQLNYLLNSNNRRFFRKGRIKFIYAIRGDLFDNLEVNDYDNAIEMKSKIFDFIIPVVPFLSENNTEAILSREAEELGLRDVPLLEIADLLEGYSYDMRVLKYFLNCLYMYEETYDVGSDNDKMNCAALALIRTFDPAEFKKLSSGKSVLNTLSKLMMEYKGEQVKKIREGSTLSGIITKHGKELWQALREKAGIGSYVSPKNIMVDGKNDLPIETGVLTRVYLCKEYVIIEWDNNVKKEFSKGEIEKIFSCIMGDAFDDAQKREAIELNNIMKLNMCEYYFSCRQEDKIKNILKESDIIKDLLSNKLINEAYAKYVARRVKGGLSMDESDNYYYEYVMKGVMNEEYYLDNKSIEKILHDLRESDFASIGLFNFYIFDYLFKYQEECNNILELIFDMGKFNLDVFMLFYRDYCNAYANSIEGQDVSEIFVIELPSGRQKNIPPIKFTILMSRKYPERIIQELANMETDSHVMKQILGFTVISSIDNLRDIELDEKEMNFVKNCFDILLDNGKGKLIYEIYVGHHIEIKDLASLGIEKNNVQDDLPILLIELNSKNIAFLGDDLLIKYLDYNLDRLTSKDIKSLFKYSNRSIKEYIVEKMKSLADLLDDTDRGEVAISISDDLIQLTYEQLEGFSGKINGNILISLLNNSRLTAEQMSKLLSRSGDKQLMKINLPNKRIKLEKSEQNIIFAEKLNKLGMVKSIRDKNGDMVLMVLGDKGL